MYSADYISYSPHKYKHFFCMITLILFLMDRRQHEGNLGLSIYRGKACEKTDFDLIQTYKYGLYRLVQNLGQL